MTFEESVEYVKQNKKVDGTKFDKASDITKIIDFLNQQRDEQKDKDNERDIVEISKFLARIQGRKMIFT